MPEKHLPTELSYETLEFSPDDIDVVNRLRPVTETGVEAVLASMAEEGQLQPIVVNGRYDPPRLIIGAHRLEAARRLGMRIRAEVVDAEDTEARLMEVDENLFRAELEPLDRAMFIGERVKLFAAAHPEVSQGGDKKSIDFKGKNQNPVAGQPPRMLMSELLAETEKRQGIGRTQIYRATRIHTHLCDEAREMVRGTPIAAREGELYQLTTLTAAGQIDALKLMLRADDPVASVREAIAELDGKKIKSDPDDALFKKLLRIWSSAPRAVQSRFKAHLGMD